MPNYWERMHAQSQERVDRRAARAKAAIKLREQGFTYDEIGKVLGCSRETVRRILWDNAH